MYSVNLSTHESYGISWDFCLCSLPRKQAVWLSKQNEVNLAKKYGVFSLGREHLDLLIFKLGSWTQTGICFRVASISELCAVEFIDLELVNNNFGKEMTYLFIYFISQSSLYDIIQWVQYSRNCKISLNINLKQHFSPPENHFRYFEM